MKMMEIIYSECGLDYDSIPNDKKLNCNKIRVATDVQERIIEKIQSNYPDLREIQILLFLLNYGPMVDENLKENMVEIKKDFLVDRNVQPNFCVKLI